MLTVTHFVANQPVQAETAQLGIRLLMGPISALFYITGAIIVLFYPIDKKKYEEILLKVKEMDAKIIK